MKKVICGVKDSKVGFGVPFFFDNEAIAVRSFASSIAQADAVSDVGLFPQDFELFKLGYFDTDTGLIEPLASPEFMRRAAEFRLDQVKGSAVVDVIPSPEN